MPKGDPAGYLPNVKKSRAKKTPKKNPDKGALRKAFADSLRKKSPF